VSSRTRAGDGVVTHREVERIATEVGRSLADVAPTIRSFEPRALVFSGGTPRRLATLATGDELPRRIDRTALVDLAVELVGRDLEEIAERGASPARAPTIDPAAVVVATLMMVLGFQRATIAKHGLRLGLLLREVERLGHAPATSLATPL
jgi:exopolyphosphatase/pppGpp-phosphohydrolase